MAISALRLGLAACIGLALAGCGSRADDPAVNLARGLLPSFGEDETPVAAPVDPRQVLTRAIIAEAGVPLILVDNTSTGSVSTLALVAVNRGNETWQGGDDVTVTLSQIGLLRATRGFGDDLMVSETSGTEAALRAGREGPTTREHVYLNANAGEDRRSFSCTLARQGQTRITIFEVTRSLTQWSEDCVPSGTNGDSFSNTYYTDRSGRIWASTQYLSDTSGPISIEVLQRN